jgi:hypothetical protein
LWEVLEVKLIKLLCAVSILALNMVACSSDDSDNKSGNADAAAYVTACKTYCQKTIDGGCQLADLATCQQLCDVFGAATGDCATKLKALGNCYNAAADLCADGVCSTEYSAMSTACASAT